MGDFGNRQRLGLDAGYNNAVICAAIASPRSPNPFRIELASARMGLMPLERGETAQVWYERAIVAKSVAAAQEESLADAGNPTAKRVARKRADETATDLQQALAALQTERGHPAG